MTHLLRLAGAASLCAALLLTACAKKSTDTTTTSTEAAQSAGAASDASASPDTGTMAAATPAAEVSPSTTPDTSGSTAPSATASSGTTSASTTTTTAPASGSNGTSSGWFITLPVYPGATETKSEAATSTTNEGSIEMHAYTSSDSPKKVAEWYRAHLPSSFKSSVTTIGEKTVGTFVDERADGDQNIIVAEGSDGKTRMQLTTKHGK